MPWLSYVKMKVIIHKCSITNNGIVTSNNPCVVIPDTNKIKIHTDCCLYNFVCVCMRVVNHREYTGCGNTTSLFIWGATYKKGSHVAASCICYYYNKRFIHLLNCIYMLRIAYWYIDFYYNIKHFEILLTASTFITLLVYHNINVYLDSQYLNMLNRYKLINILN